MGIFRRNKNAPASDVEQYSANLRLSDPAVAEYFGLTNGFLPAVTESTALKLSGVYRSVTIIAGTIASLPLKTFRNNSDGSRSRVGSFLDTPAGPESDVTSYEWKETLVVSLLLHGNAYYYKVRNTAGAVIGLEYLHPSVITPQRVNGRKVFKVNGVDRPLGTDEILHIPALSSDGIKGKGVLETARESLGTTLAGEEQAARLFNGALVSGLVTPADDDSWNEGDAQAIKEDLNSKVMGLDHAGTWAVINRTIKVTPWTLSAQDAQFLESRTFQIDEIARWFGLPPHLLGQVQKSTSWGAGISEQNHGLARYTLKPWTARIEERLSALLPSARFCEFDYAGLLQPTPEKEIELIVKQVNEGFLTLNEGRALRNLPPVEGGDAMRLPPGSVPPVEEPQEEPEPIEPDEDDDEETEEETE